MLGATPFRIARLPRIVFGAGTLKDLPVIAANYGRRALLVTGRRSFCESARWPALLKALGAAGIEVDTLRVEAEPSPQLIDDAVREFHTKDIDVVVGIGGGSVLDAAKAVAGLLPHGNSVVDHLEGVGPEIPYLGPATPFIAVPTTAGTGSEATKNAVLSVSGENGYKKSFRDEALVAQVALIDPELLATCPPEIIAANGMDAFTQLLESYVSINANGFTDTLAVDGMQSIRDSFFPAWNGGSDDAARAGRVGMAYGAMLSGITLAQTGLGSVHGLASPLGAYFPIPHGMVCGTLVATATDTNIRALNERAPDSPALVKYAAVGELLAGHSFSTPATAWRALVDTLQEWTDKLAIRRLGDYGVREEHVAKIVANARGSSMRTNPITLTDTEIGEVVRARL